jgi:signal transduction histidine kinase
VTLFLLLALATTAVFLFGMQRILQGGWQGYAKPLVADYVDRLAAEIGVPPDVRRAQAIEQRLPIAVRIEGPRVQYDTQPERRRWRTTRDDHGFGEGFSLSRSTPDGHRISFELASPVQTQRPRTLGWFTLAALLGLTALAYRQVRKLLRPLEEIGAGVEAYGRGDFSQRIAVRRGDELGDLATRINAMAQGLEGMLEAKRALLLAISHELRSPLTRARVNAELVEEGEARSALLRDLGEMRDLITDLLESERLAGGPAALQAEPVELGSWLRLLVHEQFADAGLSVAVDPAVGTVQADPMRLRLLMRNLIENALRHGAQAARPPEVFAHLMDEHRVALGVRDFGPGVTAEDLAHLAEPFYRADAARQRATGGAGLGLYLCRLVALAHGGALQFERAEPGLRVVAVLPR